MLQMLKEKDIEYLEYLRCLGSFLMWHGASCRTVDGDLDYYLVNGSVRSPTIMIQANSGIYHIAYRLRDASNTIERKEKSCICNACAVWVFS